MLSLRFSYAAGSEEKLASKNNKIEELYVIFCCNLKISVSQAGQTTQKPKPQQ